MSIEKVKHIAVAKPHWPVCWESITIGKFCTKIPQRILIWKIFMLICPDGHSICKYIFSTADFNKSMKSGKVVIR